MIHACTMHVSCTAYLSDADAFQTDHHRLATDHAKLSLCRADPQKYYPKQHPGQPAVFAAPAVPPGGYPPVSAVMLIMITFITL